MNLEEVFWVIPSFYTNKKKKKQPNSFENIHQKSGEIVSLSEKILNPNSVYCCLVTKDQLAATQEWWIMMCKGAALTPLQGFTDLYLSGLPGASGFLWLFQAR